LIPLLTLRLRQAARLLHSAGPGYLLLLLLVTAGLWLSVLGSLNELTPAVALVLGALLVGLVHLRRGDIAFLLKLEVPIRALLLCEYLLLLLPITILILLFGRSEAAGTFWASGTLSLILPLHTSTGRRYGWMPALHWLPLRLFELRIALRRNWLGFGLAWGLGLASFQHFAFYIASAAITGLLLMPAFEAFEAKDLIHYSQNFLWKKFGQNLQAVLIAMIPATTLLLLFQPAYWFLAAGALVYFTFLLFFAIIYKYACYRPGLKSVPPGNFTAIYLILLLIPGGILANFVLCIIYYRRARHNLMYFHA
jgi:hypothetical protein